MLVPDQVLQQRYKILKELGSGGMGNTFLAEDAHYFNRYCLVKELRPHSDPRKYQVIQERFQREAVILAKLGEGSNGRIPKLHAYFTEGGLFYLVQEWIEGETLREKVERDGPLDESAVVTILTDLLQTLCYVHSEKIIHRDIKPENVMLRRQNEQPALIDFGLVKEVVNLDAKGNPTSSIVVGTRIYMPLEQAAGRPVFNSDLFTLGLTAIYLLTGLNATHDSFTGKLTWRGMAKDVSDGFAKILDKATQKNFDDRYQTAAEMLEALQTMGKPVEGEGSKTEPVIEIVETEKVFEFETATVNADGTIKERRRGRAKYFVEDLGDGVTMDMIEIPGGTFMMGTAEAEIDQVIKEYMRYSISESEAKRLALWETPQHQVTVQSFFMGKHQVTQAQWRAIAGLPQLNTELDTNPSNFKGDDLPVERVSWEDATEFCARLSEKTGRTYRLPSEAEWEYACRAGTTTPFAFGETITPQIVNYGGNYPYGSAPKGENRSKTVRVGSLGIANAFGLYDMHGNVWEWCADVWHRSYSGAPTDGSAWMAGGNQNFRMLRSGSWFNPGCYCRTAKRDRNYPAISNDYDGFRVVSSGARLPAL